MTTTPDIPTLSRELCQLAGKEWHSQIGTHDGFYKCSCMASFYDSKTLIFHLDSNPNPDFRDAREVLKVIKSLGLLDEFLTDVYRNRTYTNYPDGLSVLVDMILDETGLLLQEAVEFMRGGRDERRSMVRTGKAECHSKKK